MKQPSSGRSIGQLLWRAFPWLWLVAGYLFDLWYHIVPGKWIIDGDLAAEMQLADLLNQNQSILCGDWYYSTELRVFHMQWFYRLGLLLFPDDWHAARTAAMALTLLVLIVLYLFFAHAAGFARLGVWTAAIQLWPFGRFYLFLCLYGGYYLIYSLFTFLVLGCLFHGMKTASPRRGCLWLAVACLAAFASGLNGVRQMMVLFAPLALACMTVLALSVHRQKLTRVQQIPAACPQELRMLLASLAVAVVNLAGYLVNQKVLSTRMNFRLYNDMKWSIDIWGDPPSYDVVTCLLSLLNQFGYQADQPLFSVPGIASAVGLLLGVLMFFCVIRLLQRFSALHVSYQILTALTVCAFLVDMVVFVYLNGYGVAYWLPMIPLLLICLQMEGETETVHLQGGKQAAALLLAGAFTFCSLATVRSELTNPVRGKKGLSDVCDWLVDNGYTQGYAMFWVSHALIELSSGQLDVWTTENFQTIYAWLEPAAHLREFPEAGAFVLLDSYECSTDPTVHPLLVEGGGALVYDDGRYVVYELQRAVTP